MTDYTFRLDKFTIADTRSFHNDTDVVGFAVKVNTQMFGPVIKDVGDVNNGEHALDMTLGPVPVTGDNDIVTVCYQIWNRGHDGHPNNDELITKLNEIMPDLAFKPDDPNNPSAGDPNPGDPIGDTTGISSDLIKIVETIFTFGLNILLKDCDGPVAIKKVQMFSDDLHSRTRNTKLTNFQQDKFRGKELIQQVPGVNAVPCNGGSNGLGSDYTVFWSVVRSA